ncbi:hypothetical protein CEUSTIGMA_g12568.t1 [Chlamydomonas eustigma]|uniref:Uncharacterized protein n=1 Tax=Chlamydomonas eustigma TaxID=1157962 RepID=A0A250XQC5_9CHLO|nr:hypothetical protein CEUSTIGMA_g12568.t1 [Chlamydomonas eustigma]|eukprot:GAX85149.1 hypothetical protein CEUSTIGMA_g12568.t1 [Chlamydomonas eustigma]
MEQLSSNELDRILSLVSVCDQPWTVCKAWWWSIVNNPDVMARILVNSTHEPLLELVKHAILNDFKTTIRILLASSLLNAEEDGTELLIFAVMRGSVDVVRMFLEWPSNAPPADCKDGRALVEAAENGKLDMVRLLLEWPSNAPLADCQDGRALMGAAVHGHLDVVRLLLEWPEHAPRADCRDGQAVVFAAWSGHLDVVRLLLEWPEHAPRADCQDGLALVGAAKKGHIDVVRLLLDWPEHAPRADSQVQRACLLAIRNGHIDVVCTLRIKNSVMYRAWNCVKNILRKLLHSIPNNFETRDGRRV